MKGKKPSRTRKRRSTTKIKDMPARQARSVKGGKRLIAPVRGEAVVEITSPDTKIIKDQVVTK